MKMNIVGCGRLGSTIGRALTDSESFEIQAVANRTLESSKSATDFIGSGTPVGPLDDLLPADSTMLACPDDNIESCCEQIVAAQLVRPGSFVFHCSGAHSSELLSSAAAAGAHTGSFHPVKSFADPSHAYATLPGTLGGIEGDKPCISHLQSIAEACSISTFEIDAASKLHYHAGSVLVCNYLVALLEAGYQCFDRAGLSKETASQIIGPFAAETLANVERLGTTQALTGPIARGEKRLVEAQFEALRSSDERLGAIYQSLGMMAVELSKNQGSAAKADLTAITETFKRDYR